MSSVTVHALAVLERNRKETSSSSLSPISYSMASIPLDPRIVSGSVGSIVSSVVTTPFEVAKVKLQQNKLSSSSYRPVPLRTIMANSYPYRARATCSMTTSHPTGPFSMLRHVIAKEGVQGAYAGLAPTVIMSIPNYLLYLISYDEIVYVLRSKTTLSETTVPLAGGAVARLIATTATAPLELLRTRHAASSHNTNTIQDQSIRRVWKDLSTIVRNDGVAALYKGMTPQLLRDVPFAALYMLFLERFRQWTKPTTTTYSPRQEVGLEFVNAAMAGMMAATLTAPADVIKSRAQMSFDSPTNKSSTSMLQIARSIVHNEGIRGLWRGNQARILKVAPQYSIMISCYEIGKKLLITTEEEDK